MTGSPEPETSSPASRSRILLVVAGAIVAIAVVGGIVALTMPRGGTAAADPPDQPSTTASASPAPSASASSSSRPTTAPSPAPSASSGVYQFPELDPAPPAAPVRTEAVKVSIAKVEHVQGEAVGLGDVAGPAIRLTVRITNQNSKPLNLGLVVVNGYMGDERDPAQPFIQPGGVPFSGELADGKTATGVFLFRVPLDRQDDVTITVDYLPGQPAVVFRGSFA